RLSREAFAHPAASDAAISSWLARHDEEGVPSEADAVSPWFAVTGEAVSTLRYGENPHQPATFIATDYARNEPVGLDQAIVHQGKALSYNNLLDADAALGLIRDLAPVGRAAAVFKHLSPCGAAVTSADRGMADIYVAARQADAESAFGGIVSLTDEVDEAVAERLLETFLEVVVAPGYTAGALEMLARKKNLRLLEIPAMFEGLDVAAPLRVRSVAGGVLVQREDLITVSAGQGSVATNRQPTAAELESLELAQRVCKHVKSNAVVLVRDGVTVGVGGGQTSRVEAVRQAIARAGDLAKGAVLASDAFFPFRDSVDHLAGAGVCGIIQPGGSKRDPEVIEAA
ncbi:MAG: bifunctional phosphoribosylaminoimidazolecarboxamide formyltransferase/IMP cyclohydrolase, partial [Nannocystaceae bacterium]